MTINFFWLFLILLILGQYFYTINSLSQIRYEELAESVRNVFWLQNHAVYDGVSSNIGWYGSLLVIYKIFGFSLHAAKYYRLILAAISLLCLALTFRKFFGEKKAIVPLLIFGLSPTLLYFNTLDAQFGIDWQFIPIIVYLLVSLDFSKNIAALAKQFLVGFLIMLSWMSYPTMLFYLPALFLLYLYQITRAYKKHFRLQILSGLLILAVSFLGPLVGSFFYLKDKQLLFYDPITKSGIFRGAGNLHLDFENFLFNLSRTLTDLALKANSYYFEVAMVDFSLILPFLAIIFLAITTLFLAWQDTKRRWMILLIWSALVFNLILGNLAFDPSGRPGIRRNSALLFSLYALLVVVWYYLVVLKRNFAGLRTTLIILVSVILAHHLLAYPINLVNLSQASSYQYGLGFQLADTPEKSLDLLVSQVKREDLKLSCQDEKDKQIFCRYQEMYAAVAGTCRWNNLSCRQVLGLDPKTNQFIPLDTKLWETYYWEH